MGINDRILRQTSMLMVLLRVTVTVTVSVLYCSTPSSDSTS